MAALRLGVTLRREVIRGGRLLSEKIMVKMSTRAGNRQGETSTLPLYTQTVFILSHHTFPSYIVCHLHFIEIMYRDCSVICSRWLAKPVSLFYIRVKPWGSKQRHPVVVHSSSSFDFLCSGQRKPDPSWQLSLSLYQRGLWHTCFCYLFIFILPLAATAELTLSHLRKIAFEKCIMAARSKQESCFYSCHSVAVTLQVKSTFKSRNTKSLHINWKCYLIYFNLSINRAHWWPHLWETIPDKVNLTLWGCSFCSAHTWED